MKPVRLYIENFSCYEKAFIDFREFSSALIVGKLENNDMISNGVGKTTIFKAIEYVLFNQSDVPLERVVRDDTNSCKIVLDFIVEDQEYRVSRTRTKKGSTDLTLLQRNAFDGNENETYHSISEDPYTDKKLINLYWKDLSGSRAGDTEKDLAKLIKCNYKSFSSTVLFKQNDITGLPTATPEKRKAILKDAFDLIIYSKLEKMAKDRAGSITKDIDRTQALIETLGDPSAELKSLIIQLSKVDDNLLGKNETLATLTEEVAQYNEKINDLTNTHSNLESKFTGLLVKDKTSQTEKGKIETSVKEYQSKRANIAKAAKEIVSELDSLKEQQIKLIEIDYSQIDILSEQVSVLKENVAQHNQIIKTKLEEYEELKIPLPSGSACKTCRKPMTDNDRKDHKIHLVKQMEACQLTIQETKQSIVSFNSQITTNQQTINSLSLSKQQLEGVNQKISFKNKELQDKKILHGDYSALLSKFNVELQEKLEEITIIQNELSNSSMDEANAIKIKIEEEKLKFTTLMSQITLLNKEITHYNSSKAVMQHTFDQKKNDEQRLKNLKAEQISLNEKLGVFPIVLQAFSTTGIPNLIIQNVLDDLQTEANILLAQLKPGLQLAFFVEKTKGNGDQADTLDIQYTVNGKDRYYEQLSGAMKLAVSFSLKLGLSFLLQNMTGAEVKFLLLDEIDQALDKASIDSFADIVKFFQKEFTILIITHNDRLKDKFSHAILVEQDINMVSKARVVSSW